MKEPDLISDMKDQQPNLETKLKQNSTNNSTNNNNNSSLKTIQSKSELSVKFNIEPIKLSPKINVLKCNNQIKELHTVLRDKNTSHSDFKFYSDRLIRLLVEEGLNELPYTECNIITSAGCEYNGVKYIKGVCGVSIMRSGN